MTMSWIWTGILALSLICSILGGKGSELASAIPQGAQSGITLAISIAGSLCLWTGVGKLMERTGITKLLSRWMMPVLSRLFPTCRRDAAAAHYLSSNICANFLGLGNAATPMGIQAAKRLTDPEKPTRATDQLCRLIVLNTASIQLIPSNVAAVRSGLGAVSPFDILPAVWLTSLCSASAGLLAAWIMGRLCRRD